MVCGFTAWILLKHGRGAFSSVARAAAVVLCADAVVMTFRAVLTNLYYKQADLTDRAHTDWKWLYSLAGMALLATCMVMCVLWFLVTELSKELAEQARTDPLTGALNRRAMEEAALRETTRSIRYGHLPCMIVLDIDHFKLLNDSRGHAAGDAALQALVQQIKPMMRANDVLARTGGEEFTILLPNTTASAGVAAAERVRQTIEALEIPYESGDLSMIVFLPNDAGGLPALEQSLTAASAQQWLGQLRPGSKIILALPKFKMTGQFGLNGALTALGMRQAFEQGVADFSGMTGKRDLWISAAIHKVFVDVNEEGTEAAAATAIVMRSLAVTREQPPIVFRADHPFIFLIRDNRSGGILFMGRVTDPTK